MDGSNLPTKGSSYLDDGWVRVIVGTNSRPLFDKRCWRVGSRGKPHRRRGRLNWIETLPIITRESVVGM